VRRLPTTSRSATGTDAGRSATARDAHPAVGPASPGCAGCERKPPMVGIRTARDARRRTEAARGRKTHVGCYRRRRIAARGWKTHAGCYRRRRIAARGRRTHVGCYRQRHIAARGRKSTQSTLLLEVERSRRSRRAPAPAPANVCAGGSTLDPLDPRASAGLVRDQVERGTSCPPRVASPAGWHRVVPHLSRQQSSPDACASSSHRRSVGEPWMGPGGRTVAICRSRSPS